MSWKDEPCTDPEGCDRKADVKYLMLCQMHYFQKWKSDGASYDRRPCSVKSCESMSDVNGMCEAHGYEATHRGAPSEIRRYRKGFHACIVEGCERRGHTGELCEKHYSSWYYHNVKKPKVQAARAARGA